MSNDETFYCPACKSRHKFRSVIGQKHLGIMVKDMDVVDTIETVEAARVHVDIEMATAAEPDIQPGEWCVCGKPVFTIVDGEGMCKECAKILADL